MATFTVVLHKHKKLISGEYPLMLRITINRRTIYSSLEIRVRKEHWDIKTNTIKKHPNAAKLNERIASRLAEMQSLYIDLEKKKGSASVDDLRKVINEGQQHPESFIEYFRNYIVLLGEREKHGTRDKFEAVYRKLVAYRRNRDMRFDEVNVEFLKQYDAYLRNTLKNSNNTIHGNFRIIRKLMNDAIREEIVPVNTNPFIRYKLTLDKTDKIFLSEEDVQRLYELELPHNKSYHIRNMFVFSCHAGGLRISDMLQLKNRNYDGERIILTMQKTKQVVQVKLSSIAKEIINRYSTANSDSYIFPFLIEGKDDTNSLVLFKSISSNSAYINRLLKDICMKAGINKHVSFHTSRHTFATQH
jgi:integrase/recombinase XerD